MDLNPALLLFALLALEPHSPARRCIEREAAAIVEQLGDAEDDYGMPPGVLLVVAFLETHIGCDRASGRGWGAPRSPSDRHHAGTPSDAARMLTHARARCGSWTRAITMWRSGRCVYPGHLVGYETPFAVALIERVYRRAGIGLPEDLR